VQKSIKNKKSQQKKDLSEMSRPISEYKKIVLVNKNLNLLFMIISINFA